ncbi:hypothetical protein [Nostoc sp. CCY 9925]|uniref:hypothetical protein n=1 Tax=Nostoc sp. CCY 9925 TaxID=3103865 RepID=UPI0039C687C6
MIPQSALVKRGQLEGVYVVGANNIVQLRWVKTDKVRYSKVEFSVVIGEFELSVYQFILLS